MARPILLFASTVLGLTMVCLAAVGLAGVGAPGQAPVVSWFVSWVAALAVIIGIAFRPAATVAVLLSVWTVVLSESPSPIGVGLSGFFAASYLVCRHSDRTPADVIIGSWPTSVAAVGFTFAGLVATSFPLQVPWLPLLAPLGVLAIYLFATRPFLG